jgi:hypothetical protein
MKTKFYKEISKMELKSVETNISPAKRAMFELLGKYEKLLLEMYLKECDDPFTFDDMYMTNVIPEIGEYIQWINCIKE